MVRPLIALFLTASMAAAQQPAPPPVKLPPEAKTLGDVLAAVQVQTGLTLTTTLDAKQPVTTEKREAPLWPLLTEVAAKAGGRLTVTRKGKAAVIEKGKPPPASIDGAFRVVAKQITERRDIDTDTAVGEVLLEVQCDPRLPVFRIDTEPRNVRFLDSLRPWAIYTNPTKAGVTGSVAAMTIRRNRNFTDVIGLRGPDGHGESPKLNFIGSFTVTAAARMLQFRVADTAKPTTLTQDGVTATFPGMRKIGDRWDVPVELAYPPSKVEFESFEAGVWTGRNRLQLVDPAGKPLDPINEDWRESPAAAGLRANAVYRFPAAKVPDGRAGWTLVYETPAPLVEFPVAFTLNDIPLP